MDNRIARIAGVVVKGKQKGRELGFPTANLALFDSAIKSGVYAGKVSFDDREYSVAIFVPELGDLLEVHILDFQGDLYGKKIEVAVGQKIRKVMRFESEQELVKQISKDLLQVRDFKM